jgi:hypothetical protein
LFVHNLLDFKDALLDVYIACIGWVFPRCGGPTGVPSRLCPGCRRAVRSERPGLSVGPEVPGLFGPLVTDEEPLADRIS